MSSRLITFEFEGVYYTVSIQAYEWNMIILPDGRVLEADAWLESNPPKPQGLHVVNTLTGVMASIK